MTCNYDGQQKHQTRIGARAFVGTNSSLVAPLTIGDDAYVGAGSVITRDVPAGALATERAPQEVKEGWTERRRVRGPAEPGPRRPGLTRARPPASARMAIAVKRGVPFTVAWRQRSPATPWAGARRPPRPPPEPFPVQWHGGCSYSATC